MFNFITLYCIGAFIFEGSLPLLQITFGWGIKPIEEDKSILTFAAVIAIFIMVASALAATGIWSVLFVAIPILVAGFFAIISHTVNKKPLSIICSLVAFGLSIAAIVLS